MVRRLYSNVCLAAVCFAFLGCNAPTGKQHYILAERLFTNQKYSAAVEEFRKIIDEDPKGVLSQQALFRIGVIQYLYLDRHREAVKSFKSFIALSQVPELVYQAEKTLGEIYLNRMEDFKSAAEEYKTLLEKYPKSEERDFLLLRLGKAQYGAMDFAGALQSYVTLIKQFPKSTYRPEAHYLIGNTKYTKGDYEGAIAAFREVANRFSGSDQAVFALFGIASCLEENDELPEALDLYTKLLDKHPARNVVEGKIALLKEKMAKKN